MKKKQLVRQKFKEAVFERDNSTCKTCGKEAVDAHHITDRSEMPDGGYVKENGISLCSDCHRIAEGYHISGGLIWVEGFHPNSLYKLIGSSKEEALKASET